MARFVTRIFTLLLTMLLCQGLVGQSKNGPLLENPLGSAHDVVPPSPTAAGLTRFVDVPVGLHTGTAQYQIPLGTISVGGLSVPLTLDYATNGVRVDDIGTWVGMGWSLSTGGAVNRTVRDEPDEYAHGVFWDFPQASTRFLESAMFAEVVEQLMTSNSVDGEPDAFSYSWPHGGGKFYMRAGKPVLLNRCADSLLFGVDDSGKDFFELRTAASATYLYGAGETEFNTGNKYRVKCTTSWLMSKMSNLDGDTIVFRYSNCGYNYVGARTFSMIGSLNRPCESCPGTGLEGPVESNAGIYGKRLSEIMANDGSRAVFHSSDDGAIGVRLDSVVMIAPDGSVLSRHHFSYAYYNQRRFLTRLESRGSDTDKLLFGFSYYDTGIIPPRLDYGRDHWGFANGAHNTNTMPHFPAIGFDGQNADRNPNLVYARAGSLREVSLPTGGTHSFEYELNTSLALGTEDLDRFILHLFDGATRDTIKEAEIIVPFDQDVLFTLATSPDANTTQYGPKWHALFILEDENGSEVEAWTISQEIRFFIRVCG